MQRRRDYIEGYRITRLDEVLIIESTDYHARPLRLTPKELSELGLRFGRVGGGGGKDGTGKKKPEKSPANEAGA
jgi:hypothetical protein